MFERTIPERIESIRKALEEEKVMRQKVLGKNPEYQQRRVQQMVNALADLAAIEYAYRKQGEPG